VPPRPLERAIRGQQHFGRAQESFLREP